MDDSNENHLEPPPPSKPIHVSRMLLFDANNPQNAMVIRPPTQANRDSLGLLHLEKVATDEQLKVAYDRMVRERDRDRNSAPFQTMLRNFRSDQAAKAVEVAAVMGLYKSTFHTPSTTARYIQRPTLPPLGPHSSKAAKAIVSLMPNVLQADACRRASCQRLLLEQQAGKAVKQDRFLRKPKLNPVVASRSVSLSKHISASATKQASATKPITASRSVSACKQVLVTSKKASESKPSWASKSVSTFNPLLVASKSVSSFNPSWASKPISTLKLPLNSKFPLTTKLGYTASKPVLESRSKKLDTSKARVTNFQTQSTTKLSTKPVSGRSVPIASKTDPTTHFGKTGSTTHVGKPTKSKASLRRIPSVTEQVNNPTLHPFLHWSKESNFFHFKIPKPNSPAKASSSKANLQTPKKK